MEQNEAIDCFQNCLTLVEKIKIELQGKYSMNIVENASIGYQYLITCINTKSDSKHIVFGSFQLIMILLILSEREEDYGKLWNVV